MLPFRWKLSVLWFVLPYSPFICVSKCILYLFYIYIYYVHVCNWVLVSRYWGAAVSNTLFRCWCVMLVAMPANHNFKDIDELFFSLLLPLLLISIIYMKNLWVYVPHFPGHLVTWMNFFDERRISNRCLSCLWVKLF